MTQQNRTPSSPDRLRRVIARLLDGADGITERKLHEALPLIDRDAAKAMLSKLIASAPLYGAQGPGAKARTHYFRSQALADAWKVQQVKKPRAKPFREPAKLHDLGAVIPGVIQRDGKATPVHNQTVMRSPRPTLHADSDRRAPVKVTVCPSGHDYRFTATGEIPRAVDSRDCRPWALAATGAR